MCLAALSESSGGSIILTGSIASVKGIANASVYCASKAAVRALGRSWAAELAHRHIRVNVISPGPIDTAAFDGKDDLKAAFVSMVPLKRIGQADEIASVALFFASKDSSFITGAEQFVDGGLAQV